jgi:hypothetical protein
MVARVVLAPPTIVVIKHDPLAGRCAERSTSCGREYFEVEGVRISQHHASAQRRDQIQRIASSVQVVVVATQRRSIDQRVAVVLVAIVATVSPP